MQAASKKCWSVYLPALLLIAAMIALTLMRRPWPASVPVHFNLRFQPDRWGSPWEATIFIPIVALITASGILSSFMWTRHEEGRKRFNPSVPFTALPLGAVAGIHFWYWCNLLALAQTGFAPHPWLWVAIVAFLNFGASLFLEKRRSSAG